MGEPQFDHRMGDSLLRRVWEGEEEMDTLLAHLRAVVSNGKSDPSWTGWVHALEMLIPDSPPRLEELKADLAAKGFGHLAERMEALQRRGSEGEQG